MKEADRMRGEIGEMNVQQIEEGNAQSLPQAALHRAEDPQEADHQVPPQDHQAESNFFYFTIFK